MHPISASASASGDSTGAPYPPDQPRPDDCESSTTKNTSKLHKNQSSVTVTASIPGTTGDISVLSLLYEFHTKTGRIPTSANEDLHNFYEYWIKLRIPGVYANKEALEATINELHSRFLWNMRTDVDIPIGPINVNIFQLSSYIWHDDEVDTMSDEFSTPDCEQCSAELSDATSWISGNDLYSDNGKDDGSSSF